MSYNSITKKKKEYLAVLKRYYNLTKFERLQGIYKYNVSGY